MTENDDPKVNVDKQLRVCDKVGRPLRDHSIASYSGPFMGRDGQPHPRASRLAARIKSFDEGRFREGSRRKPGSLKK